MSKTLTLSKAASTPGRIDTAAPEKVAAGVTRFGKTILIERVKNGRTFRVRFEEGGQLPGELDGEFTRASSAQAAIDTYVARQGIEHKQ